MARKKKLNLTWRELWPIWLVFTLLITLGGLGIWLYTPAVGKPAVQITTEDVVLKTAALTTARPQLFSYPLPDSTKVELFARRIGEGRVQVAFASCRTCYRVGHFEQDHQIMCGRCNAPMEVLPEGQASGKEDDCKLISIPYEQADGQIVIRGPAIRDTFNRWYRPVVAGSGQHE